MSFVFMIAFLLVFGLASCDDPTEVHANTRNNLRKTDTRSMVLAAPQVPTDTSVPVKTGSEKQEFAGITSSSPPPSLVESSAAEIKSDARANGVGLAAGSLPSAVVENSAAEKTHAEKEVAAGLQNGGRQMQRAPHWGKFLLLLSMMIKSDPGVAAVWGAPNAGLQLDKLLTSTGDLRKNVLDNVGELRKNVLDNVSDQTLRQAKDAVLKVVGKKVTSSLFSKNLIERRVADSIAQWYLRTHGTRMVKVKYGLACTIRRVADSIEDRTVCRYKVHHEALKQGLLETPPATQQPDPVGTGPSLTELNLTSDINAKEMEWLEEEIARRACEQLEALFGHRNEQDVKEKVKAPASFRETANEAQQGESEMYLLTLRTADGLRDEELLNRLKSMDLPKGFNLAKVKFTISEHLEVVVEKMALEAPLEALLAVGCTPDEE